MNKLKLLFYLEPSIQSGQPYFHINWGHEYIRLFRLFQTKGAEGIFVCPSHLAKEFENLPEGLKLVTVLPSDLLYHFGEATDLSRHFYGFAQKGPHGVSFKKYSAWLQQACGDFQPDFCFVYNTPAPFLKEAFPSAMVIHQETGIFSRPPFPLTNYMDPFGHYDETYLNLFSEKLLTGSLSPEARNELESFRLKIFDNLIVPRSPFRLENYINGRSFKRKVLFPLQFFNFNDFRADIGHGSQIEVLIQLLDTVGPATAIVVTQHQGHRVLNSEILKFLRSEYRNFVFHSDFDNWYASSQYLFHQVDAVFSVCSSVGLQGLLARKPFFSMGSSGISQLAHSRDINEIVPMLDAGHFESRDFALHHLLNHYYLPRSVLHDGELLIPHLLNLRNLYTRGELNFELAGPIPTPSATVFQDLESAIDSHWTPSHIPEWAGIDALKNDPLYFDTYVKFQHLTERFNALAADYERVKGALEQYQKSKVLAVPRAIRRGLIRARSVGQRLMHRSSVSQ